MKYLIALLLLFSSSAIADRYFYVEVGAGHNTSIWGGRPWDDGNGLGATFTLGWTGNILQSDHWYGTVKWSHFSQWNVGKPFNDETESKLDHFGVGLQYRF